MKWQLGQRPLSGDDRRYVNTVALGAITGFATLCAVYGALSLTGYLPPPPLSNNYCVDEKLVFLRESTPNRPNFLTIGSSIAWRNVDSSVLARGRLDVRPLNGGFCGMQLHQSAFVAGWMTDRWPSIQYILLIVSPMDYHNCDQPDQVFDPADAAQFVLEGAPAWKMYLRYFDPVSLARNVNRQIHDRAQARILGITRGFTPYGDGPLDTVRNRGLFYGPVARLDPACFKALHSLAAKLATEDRRLTVVTMPMHPDWVAQHDPDGSLRRRVSLQIELALKDTGADLWNAAGGQVLDADAFTDAIHIRWSAAGSFTEKIMRNLRF